MQVILYSWKITEANLIGGLSFVTSPFDKDNTRKTVEVANIQELEKAMDDFAEELRQTGKPFSIGQHQDKGGRAFRGYKDFRKKIYVNTEALEEAAKAKQT